MEALDPRTLEAAATSLGAAIPTTPSLIDAWRQLHHAVQIAAEVGKSWAVPQADDSHSNFEFRDGFLLGAPIPAARPFRAALRTQDLALRLVAEDGAVLAARTLGGATVAEATAWVRAQAALSTGVEERQPSVSAPDLPAHPVAAGAPFALPDRAASGALARLLAGADAVLRAVAAQVPGAAPVRLWPHHLDIATLATLSPERTIGVGLAVPDALEASGYWYVSPWSAQPPAASETSWPPLAQGRFEGRGGSLRMAVLPLASCASIEKDDERGRAIALFLAEAVAISATNLGGRSPSVRCAAPRAPCGLRASSSR